jgi:hypothetical protein
MRRGERGLGDQRLHLSDLRVEESDLAHGGVDRLALLERQPQAG